MGLAFADGEGFHRFSIGGHKGSELFKGLTSYLKFGGRKMQQPQNSITFVPVWYTKKITAMTIISSREFREKQKHYLDRVDNGEQIVIQRKRNRSYKLVPVTKEETLMTEEEFFAKIDHSLQQAKEGKTKLISDSFEIEKLLGF